MSLSRRIIEIIETPFLKLYNSRKRNVRFERFSRIDKQSIFEGSNRLGQNCILIDSYLGYGTYIAANTRLQKVWVGKYSSIGSYVEVINGNHPTKKFVSTHPAFYAPKNVTPINYVERQKFEELDWVQVNGKSVYARIGNDVWIGNHVLIKAGITIGDGAIIGAGAIVTKDVEPYSIVAGCPAHEIRKRFSESQISKLLEIKWWNQSFEWIKNHAEQFEDVDNFLAEWTEEENVYSDCNNSL